MKIKKIEKIEHNSLRYDIEVKDNHNFFANGLLVHNSCGISYYSGGIYGIATRGSFSSEQAIWATELLNTKYSHLLPYLDWQNYTFIFEICYDKNRIVCHYDFEDIVLLAIIENKTGKSLSVADIYKHYSKDFRLVHWEENLSGMSFEKIKALNKENEEGYVLHFEDDTRVKLKFADYCRLHSIITNFCARDIWEALKDGKDLTTILEDVPDEFDKWVRYKVLTLRQDFQMYFDKVVEARKNVILALLPEVRHNKKEFAKINLRLNKDKGIAGMVFSLESGRDISQKIWEKVYPPHEKAFTKGLEDEE